jgi:hypothetical protein
VRETGFELLVFTVDPERAAAVLAAGAAAIVVDWENQDKYTRQAGADTEINHHGVAELCAVRTACAGRVICRVNGMREGWEREVETALAAGADEILLPMVGSRAEVEALCGLLQGRAEASILLETRAGLAVAGELGELPLRRVYVGLNDLAIDLGNRNLFTPVANGTLDACRAQVRAPFGFGGLTVPEGGAPIPCQLLAGELSRLRCSFAFLRRSFWRDTAGRELGTEVRRILAMMEAARGRTAEAVAADREAFQRAVESAQWPG